jgi:hypothetical protein
MVIPPDDFVLRASNKIDPKLYFIGKGKVELFLEIGNKYDEKKVKILSEIDENGTFGQL